MSNFAQEERSLAGTNIIWSLAVELSCGFGTNWKFVHWGASLPAVQAPNFSAAATSMPEMAVPITTMAGRTIAEQ